MAEKMSAFTRDHIVAALKAGRTAELLADETGHTIAEIRELESRYLNRKEKARNMATELTKEAYEAWLQTPSPKTGKPRERRGKSVKSWLLEIGSDANAEEIEKIVKPGMTPRRDRGQGASSTTTRTRVQYTPTTNASSNGLGLAIGLENIIPGFADRVKSRAAEAPPVLSVSQRIAKVAEELETLRKAKRTLEIQIEIVDTTTREKEARFKALLSGHDPDEDQGEDEETSSTLDTSDTQAPETGKSGGKGKGRR